MEFGFCGSRRVRRSRSPPLSPEHDPCAEYTVFFLYRILRESGNRLMPQAPCTRAQMVTMLNRLLGE